MAVRAVRTPPEILEGQMDVWDCIREVENAKAMQVRRRAGEAEPQDKPRREMVCALQAVRPQD